MPPTPPKVPGPQASGAGGEEVMEEPVHAGLPPWLDAAFPWMVSVTFHLGLFLVFTFAIWIHQRPVNDDTEKIIIPSSFQDESNLPQVEHPGLNGDPNRDARQNLIENVKTQGWAETESPDNLQSALAGENAENVADMIALGTGGSIGKGSGGTGKGTGGVLAPYGTPGGGSGIGVKFFQTKANAHKYVYILDHSGSMLETFDYLREEAKRSVNGMLPVQSFSVVMVSESASVIFPALVRATPDNKKEFANKIATYAAKGQNDELLEPFKEAFVKAFAMQPEIIWFLTDGKSDPKLIQVVDDLNKGKKVRVNTIGYLTEHDPMCEDQLKDIAKHNGGQFKSVKEQDLGK